MDPDTQELWKLEGCLERELTQLGQRALLEHGHSQGHATFELLLSIEPSFENPRVWTVDAQGFPERTYLARRLLWRRDLDSERPQAIIGDKITRLKYRYGKLEPQLPTLETTELSLAPEAIEPLLNKLHHLTLPLRAPPLNAVGLDGTAYRFELHGPMWHVSLAWWENQPQTWDALHVIANQLMTLLGDRETR